jgi:hypothetical protein
MLTFAYEPALRAAVFNVPPGTIVYQNVLSTGDRPAFAADILGTRTPSLLNNEYGITSLDGTVLAAPHFNDNLPLHGEPPRDKTVPGALAIQRVIDRMAWVSQPMNTVAFARLLRGASLPRVPSRPFILQAARSDQTLPNPSTWQLVRAGQFEERLSLYRHDLHFGAEGVPANPHAFLSSLNPKTPDYQRIALGAQLQVGVFFASDGTKVIHPEPRELWEVPIKTPLPEDLFYLPRPK